MIPRGRGKAFPQKFINFQVLSIWECFTLNLTTQGQFIGESGEGFAVKIVSSVYLKKNLIA